MSSGGEEKKRNSLARNQIAFEVVPGVSSAIAVPAYAGIPVTHRALASSFAVVTGHEDPAKAGSSINWEKLATAIDTLIFLMGLRNLPEIVARLVEHGRPIATPVAIVKDGTRPQQQTVVGTLRDIVSRATEAALTPPAILIVGDVVRLRETVRWFDNHPLFGKRILVTRATHRRAHSASCLPNAALCPWSCPRSPSSRYPKTKNSNRQS